MGRPPRDEVEFVSENHLEAIKSLITQGGAVDAAVAFWGNGAVEHLKLAEVKEGSTFVCNLFSTGCNPHEIKRLYNLKRFKIRHHEGLHAKVYWTREAVCIGSSNVSNAGLGFYQKPSTNLPQREANIICRDPATIKVTRAWLDRIIAESTEVKKTHIDLAILKYRPTTTPQDVIELVDLPTAILKELKIAVLVWAVELDAATKKKVAKIASEHAELVAADCYVDKPRHAPRYPYGYCALEFKASPDRSRLGKFQRVRFFPLQQKWKATAGERIIWTFPVKRRGENWSIPGCQINIGERSRKTIQDCIENRKIRLRHDLHTQDEEDGFVTWEPLHELLGGGR